MNAGGVGSTKFSEPFPRGVHAARQKHAPCVEMVRELLSNTTIRLYIGGYVLCYLHTLYLPLFIICTNSSI